MKRRYRVALFLGVDESVIHNGILEYAASENWLVDDSYFHTREIPRNPDFDGILTLLPYQAPPELLEFIRHSPVPVVDLTLEHPDIPVQRVIYDNFAIGAAGAKHLLECGFRRFFYYQITDAQVERERFRGFRSVIGPTGCELVHLNLAAAGVDITRMATRIETLGRALRKLTFPVGAMAQCDTTLYEFFRCCQERRIAVPDDIGLVGADNDELRSRLVIIPLSSVENRRDELGHLAAARLDELMHGASPGEPILLHPRGVVGRESTNIVACEHPVLAKALTFIKRNYQRRILAGDVATAAGVSRRGLFSLFKEHLHHSVADEIREHRLRRARVLLRESDEKVAAIAQECGFLHGAHLSRVFMRAEKRSCLQFRRQPEEE